MAVDGLRRERDLIVGRWFERVLQTYPPQAVRFLAAESDPFRNPVGCTIRRELVRLYDQVLDGVEASVARQSLDEIIRIRAVQDLRPSEAVGFVLALKQVLRENVPGELDGTWTEIERRIDELALLAFDVYMECRERLFRIRAEAIRRSCGVWPRARPGRQTHSSDRVVGSDDRSFDPDAAGDDQ